MWSVKQLREKGGPSQVLAAKQAQLQRKAGGAGGVDMSVGFSGSVWVPDEQKVWTVATVLEEKESTLLVRIPGDESGPCEVPRKSVHQYDPSHALDLDDASRMNGMHEAPLLDLLLRRFRQDKIYTNMADVLVSVNPYKKIPLLYEIPLLQMQDDSEDEYEESDGEDDTMVPSSSPLDARPEAMKRRLSKPHVHSVADRAFRYMTEPGQEYEHGKARCLNQSVIITGESGAGKTEASKYVMRYLITAAQVLAGLSSEGPVDAMAKRIEAVLMESNTVLEAFGNAKTLRNDNSSRFGKYIKLQYDATFRLVGARTEHFLLEKSRLVRVDQAERGYHIFYQMCSGALPQDVTAALHLADPTKFRCIAMGGCTALGDEVDDASEFRASQGALATLGFTAAETAAVWRLLAAILHMGNIDFTDLQVGAGAVGGEDQTAMVSGELISLGALEELLGLSGGALAKRVVRRAMVTARGSMHEIPLNSSQAKDNLDGLVKHVYGALFAWVVFKINRCHREQVIEGTKEAAEEDGDSKAAAAAAARAVSASAARSFIGILDIFGFEIMATNSFEQLCINFANEVLQRQFNHHVFVLEQQEYTAEGLDVTSIPFRDNQGIIDLIAKKPLGLMPILEDQGLTGRKAHALNNLTDKKLLDLYHQAHHRNAPHPNYEKPRFENDQFVLRHFAGSVVYDIAGFLEKNNDSLQGDLRILLSESTDPLIRCLVSGEGDAGFEAAALAVENGESLPPPPQATVAAHRRAGFGADAGVDKLASASTVSQTFRKQLESLVEQLSATEPHYIKCIKPNNMKAPSGWSSQLVIQQLRYSGVLEVVRIRREAFPTRITFVEFYRRFGQLINWRARGLAPPETIGADAARAAVLNSALADAARAACAEICAKALESTADYQLGTPKVFLKDDGLDRLRWALQQHYVAGATGIQRVWRGYAARKALQQQDKAAIRVQRIARGFIARCLAKRLAKERRRSREAASVTIQKYARRLLARKWGKAAIQKARADAAAATAIQAMVRGKLARMHLRTAVVAATALQCMARGLAARKTFCSLKTQDRLKREREARKATKMEAWARMVLARKALARSRFAATAIQAAVRGFLARCAFARARAAETRIAAAARGAAARAAYKRSVAGVVLVQALARRLIARRRYARALAAARRIQRAGRAFARNKRLEAAVKALFAEAATGDANGVTAGITDWPELLFVRNRWDAGRTFGSLVHAAAAAGRLDIVALLEPFPEDVYGRDKLGNTCMHYAAGVAHYDLCKYLAKRANMDVEAALAREEAKETEASLLSSRKISSNINVFKQARTARARDVRRIGAVKAKANKGGTGFDESTLLMAGYLKKRRETDSMSRCEGTRGHRLLQVMAGYLNKRCSTDRWIRRWCVLTETHLMYFHKKTDLEPSKAIRLDSAMLKKSEHVDFAFELHTPDLLDKKNREGRLYFQAETEGSLQTWMVPLRMVVGLYQFRHDKRREPMEFLDLAGRRALVRVTNRAGETPLHLAARAREPEAAAARPGGPVAVQQVRQLAAHTCCQLPAREPAAAARSNGPGIVQQVAAWLVENGADPNAQDRRGATALHDAAEHCNAAAAAVLAWKGGDLSLARPADGKSVVDIVKGERELALLMQKHFHPTERAPLLAPPEKLFGFTYLSLLLERTTMASTDALVSPFLSVSVYNGKGQLSEAQQDVVFPCLTRPGYLWWAQTWHMQNPLETLGAGSVIVVELRDQGEAKRARTVSWGVYALDLDDLNTRAETLNMYAAPVDLSLKRLELAEVIIQGEAFLTKGGKRAAPGGPESPPGRHIAG
ncbi:P-loop containing nucleoside triphosphate hydrolase protein [Tribonema minus]|uniref:P-loop containing nucleoside triphosphate hydrolase protein n=1 Tax=Tribonema minus TaxID=303371 RepID=A0A835ZQ73_9STRA|nr:P-loop containing nucleoside triphosphate hydrolase protein [Tribonema minus]